MTFLDSIRCKLGRRKTIVKGNRTFFVNNKVPQGYGDYLSAKFTKNEIISSKYTVWNFLPVNLFEQFRRVANFYFLSIAVITLFIPDSPVSPATTWLPLLFVVVVTAIKQAYEDYLRHRSDREINLKPIDILRDGQLKTIKSKHIQVGDIIKVSRDESFPCDLILLSSCNNEGKCFITTANLDGETNLKVKVSPKETRECNSLDKLDSLRAMVECQNPDVNLYRFLGNLTTYGNDSQSSVVTSLSLDNLLLRGSRLKDTDFIYGCVVYTGRDTKLALNSKITTNKFSTVERSMNVFLFVFVAILVLEISVCTMQLYLFIPNLKTCALSPVTPAADCQHGFGDYFFYLGDDTTAVLDNLLSFMVLFNYIIPISLYVTIELQKFFGSMFFKWDTELYCPISEEGAICNTSDLNEELGQVQYLLTDKTGTLTENNMEFRQCSIDGHKFVEKDGSLQILADQNDLIYQPVFTFPPAVEQFLVTLALCHTVHIANGSDRKPRDQPVSQGIDNVSFAPDVFDYDYQASSPDEKALVEACRRLGIIFHGEANDTLRLTVMGEERLYKRLHVLEFDSRRKRMSVIYQFPDGSIRLVCKGAESSVLPRCMDGPVDQTLSHIDDYALLGLRTLAVAVRSFTQNQYQEVDSLLQAASQCLLDREGQMGRAFDSIETGMTLLGATAVEDQLQEQVPETLEALRAAGIKIWVLTGDKLETAVNIAHSCGHFKRGTELMELNHQNMGVERTDETLARFRKRLWDEPHDNIGMVIDGESLAVALKDHRQLLTEICSQCTAVVCCRMSPLQKAEVVRLVKSFPEKPITAAIGDGANDVSMIQEAHIGLGVMGKEGRQAVRCSDFAFARFRFLRRVLLVHGHWYYWRVSSLVQYFFYKNIAFNTPVVFFTIFSAYSTQSLYDGIFLTFFNLIFTALPILVFGMLDQNFTSAELYNQFHLYRSISGNALLSWPQFFKWILLGLWHAAVIYFGTMFVAYFEIDVTGDGQTLDLFSFGALNVQLVVLVVSLKLLIESRYWTAIFVLSIAASILIGFVGLIMLYSSFVVSYFANENMVGSYLIVISSLACWLTVLLLVVICLLPDYLVAIWETYSTRSTNAVVDAERIVRKKLDRMVSFLSQKTNASFDVSLHSSSYELDDVVS